MPTSNEDISAKVDELQAALDTEQEQVAAAIDALKATVTDLQAQVAAGGTEEARQAIADKINAVITDLGGTVE